MELEDRCPGTPGTVILGDIDGDGTVNGRDLARLIETWGPVPEGSCILVDLDLDQEVGIVDLIRLLGRWTD